MAWDFSTDPEYAAKLDWARAFVREEIWPLETVAPGLPQAALDQLYAPLQEEVRRQGLWAAHLDPALGGQGYGQVELGLLHEVLGSSPYAPNAFGCQAPDSGQQRDPGAGGHAGAEGALPRAAAGRRPAIGVLDDRARQPGKRPHHVEDARRPRRRRVRHHRAQVVLLQRVDRRRPDRHGRHRPRRT